MTPDKGVTVSLRRVPSCHVQMEYGCAYSAASLLRAQQTWAGGDRLYLGKAILAETGRWAPARVRHRPASPPRFSQNLMWPPAAPMAPVAIRAARAQPLSGVSPTPSGSIYSLPL
jgi:hypothetical protein